MTDRRGLLRAIAAARGGDPLPRLVYADWLDEAGLAARAALVRDCALGRRKGDAWFTLYAREWRLDSRYSVPLTPAEVTAITAGWPNRMGAATAAYVTGGLLGFLRAPLTPLRRALPAFLALEPVDWVDPVNVRADFTDGPGEPVYPETRSVRLTRYLLRVGAYRAYGSYQELRIGVSAAVIADALDPESEGL